MQHDLNALALQRELRVQRQLADAAGDENRAPKQGAKRNSCETNAGQQGITIVLLNNNGGAIFDMLPQKSQEAYFERLFLTPQDVDFQAAVAAFGVPYSKTVTLAEDVYKRQRKESSAKAAGFWGMGLWKGKSVGERRV